MLELAFNVIEGMSNLEIVKAIDSCVDTLCYDFKNNPSSYFTENDLVCRFYQLFSSEIGDYEVKDRDGNPHRIIHMEYPTPFKCSMKGTDFRLKANDSRYRRGHFDIVVLNRDIIRQLNFQEVRSQNFPMVMNNVLNKVNRSCPMILYAPEFLFHRDCMKKKGPEDFGRKINQDHLKLIKANNPGTELFGKNNFVQNYLTVAFFYDSTQENNIRKFVQYDDGRVRYQSCDSDKNPLR